MPNFKKTRGFSLRSGNKPSMSSFKMMGSTTPSPITRMSSFGIGQGTTPAPVKDAWADAKKKDPNLDKYVAERDKHEKGSAEYEKYQAKINAAHGKVRNQKTLKKDQANLKNKVEEIDAEETNATKTAADGITENLNNMEAPEVNKWASLASKAKGGLVSGLTGGLDAVYGTGQVLSDGQVVFSKKKKKEEGTETGEQKVDKIINKEA